MVVIDNGSTTPTVDRIAHWASSVGARYIRNERNLGLTQPFNVGARIAIENGCDWLCVMDQDTTVSQSLVADLDYFVDMVETEYCLRLATRGYRVILACRATIDHHIGHPTTHRLLGRTISTSNHSAWRRYYL